jgi:type I restriction-modification system DNA methylase subunit
MKFDKLLQNIAHKHRFSNVFDDFMQMTICAFSYGRMEQEYLEIINRYEKKDQELFAYALGQMIMDYEATTTADGGWTDLLGRCYEENASQSGRSNMGQFFTPEHLCTLMAQILNNPVEALLTGPDDMEIKDDITVNDCAAGSSRNLIAHSRMHPNNRLKSFYVAQDLDYTCVKMSVLNYIMFGMKGVVIHMNTISMEVYRGYRVYLPETGLGVRPMSKNECLQFLLADKEADVVKEVPAERSSVVVKKNMPLTLFD